MVQVLEAGGLKKYKNRKENKMKNKMEEAKKVVLKILSETKTSLTHDQVSKLADRIIKNYLLNQQKGN